jgi:dolichol-phosphate mannosyltransferase
MVGRAAGLASALMLCLSAKFLYQAGMLTFDSLTALWVLASLAPAHVALTGTKLRPGLWTLAALACGFGILTKGPVAPALVLPPLALWQFLDRRCVRLRPGDWALFAGIACGVAAPWFGAVLWRDPRAVLDFFWTHNLVRYLQPLDHQEPVWFYVLPVLVGMLPWSLLLFPLGRHLARRSIRTARRRPAALGFFVLTLVWCLAFFSLSGCKRQGYILPAFPLFALVLGSYVAHAVAWQRMMSWQPVRVHPGWNTLAHRATLATLGLAVCVGAAAGLRGIWTWPIAALWGLALSAGVIALARRGPSRLPWRTAGLCGLTMFALLLVAVYEVLPSYHRLFALRGQVRRHRDLTEDAALPVASYPKRWDSVSFYLQRDDVAAYSAERRADLIHDLRQQGRTLLFVKQGAALDDLLEALPEDLQFTPRGRAGAIVVPGIVHVKGK